MGWGGSTDWPVAGAIVSFPNSEGFAALNGKARATISDPKAFAVAESTYPAGSNFSAGPLVVDFAEVCAACLEEGDLDLVFDTLRVGWLRFVAISAPA
jgi:hypothetical protein